MAYGESNGYVTLKSQRRDRNTLGVQYLENSWRCYLETITNYSRWSAMLQYGRLS